MYNADYRKVEGAASLSLSHRHTYTQFAKAAADNKPVHGFLM